MDTEQQQKKNVQFPRPLMEQVLLRLPVKSFVRFRSLSKQFLSLLTDPQFIKSHADLGAAPTNALLTMCSTSKALWVDLDASIRREHLVSLPVRCDHELMMIDSCRGFVMLDHVRYWRGPILLWNPLTGLHKEVKYPSACLGGSHSLRCGFGYDETTDDYLVVVRCVVREPRWQFFSVRTNSWKEFEITHSPRLISIDRDVYGVFFNGAIHWLATTEHDGVQSKVIIALDLAEKSISEMLLPDFEEGDLSKLLVVGGSLGVCHHWKGHHKVWVMKEYKLHTTWTQHYTNSIVPRCFSTTGVRFTPTLLSLPSDFEE